MLVEYDSGVGRGAAAISNAARLRAAKDEIAARDDVRVVLRRMREVGAARPSVAAIAGAANGGSDDDDGDGNGDADPSSRKPVGADAANDVVVSGQPREEDLNDGDDEKDELATRARTDAQLEVCCVDAACAHSNGFFAVLTAAVYFKEPDDAVLLRHQRPRHARQAGFRVLAAWCTPRDRSHSRHQKGRLAQHEQHHEPLVGQARGADSVKGVRDHHGGQRL